MRSVSLALLAAGAVTLAFGTAVRADNDTIRLGTSSSGTVSDVTGDVGTSLVAYRHYRGGYYGGYRGGYYGAYRGGYYGGYAWHHHYRPYYYGGYYRPYYAGYYGGYRPYYGGYYGGYYRPYYGAAYYGVSYWPCSAQTAPVVVTVNEPASPPAPVAPPVYQAQAPTPQLLPAPTPVPQPSSYPYDGGPKALVPLPSPDTVDPTFGPRPTVPVQGKLVYHLEAETTGGSTQLQTVSLHSTPATPPAATPRYSYAAYGEQPLPPVTRKSAR